MWKDIKINNEIYMLNVIHADDTKVILTNLIEIWMETLTNEVILDRCRELNPLLDVEALNYNEIILNILKNISEHIVEASVEKLKLQTQIAGVPMKFTVNLSKGTSQHFWEIITKPLCISSMEIMRQHEFLLDLVKKKDKEIAEYKAEGAELIRKNIETKTFIEEQLKTDIPTPNVTDCTEAFQRVANFYDKFNLHECNANVMKCTSVNSTNTEIKQPEHAKINLTELNDDKKVSNGDTLVKRKTERLESKTHDRRKEVSRKEEGSKKSRTANMMYKPVKKLKNGLNGFIL